MPLLHRTVLAVALLAVAPLASAAQTSDFQVSIEINNACDIVANDLVFPDTDDLNTADITASTTVEVECSNTGPIEIAFSQGAGSSFGTRQMVSGADRINYSLYRDSAHTEVLGDATTGSSSVVIEATSTGGTTDSYNVYGLVPQGQGPKPVGSYTDTITASVTF